MSTLVVQPDGTAGLDTFLDSGNPTINYGTNVDLYFGAVVGKLTFLYHTILQFDITALLGIGASPVTAVTLDFNVLGAAAATSGTHKIRRIRRADWSETQATQTDYKTATAWSTAGAQHTTNDVDDTMVPTYTGPSGTGAFNIPTSSGLVAIFNDAIDNRSGIVIVMFQKVDESSTDQWTTDSAESTTAANRPKATITYTAAGATSLPIVRTPIRNLLVTR